MQTSTTCIYNKSDDNNNNSSRRNNNPGVCLSKCSPSTGTNNRCTLLTVVVNTVGD